jgi:hypothetical protein
VTGNENYRQKNASLNQASTRQSYVENNASRRIGTRSPKKLLRGFKGDHQQISRLKKIADAFTRGGASSTISMSGCSVIISH